jgi:hypothetical protein
MFVVISASPVESSGAATAIASAPTSQAADLNTEELPSFIDRFMSESLGRYHAPGPSVVVQEGAVTFEKG